MKFYLKIFTPILLILFSVNISAQENGFYSNQYIINAGIGMLSSKEGRYADYSGGEYDKRLIPIYISAETRDIKGILGSDINFLGLGLYVNYTRHKHNYFTSWLGYTYQDVKWHSLGIGFRASIYVIDALNYIQKKENQARNLDLYIGILGGYERQFLISSANDDLGVGWDKPRQIAPFAGVRYLINDKFSAYAELGRTAYGTFNVGASFGL